MTKTTAAALFAISALTSCSHAPPASVSKEVCAADAARLCPDVKPGSGRVLACLRQAKDRLSPSCQVAVVTPDDAKVTLADACKPSADALCPRLSGAAAFDCLRWRYADLPQACQDAMWLAQEKHDQFKAICGGDAARLCKDVAPGEGRIVACLRARSGEVSPVCREFVSP